MNRRRRVCARNVLFVFILSALAWVTLPATDSIQWKQIGPGGGGNSLAVGVSPADPNIVLMGSDVGGIFRSSDGGQTWSLRNMADTPPAHDGAYGYFGRFAFDPSAPSNIYYGPQKSSDSGLTWQTKIDETVMTAGGGLVDPVNHNTVYAYAYGNVFRSSDGWESTSCQGVPDGGNTCATGGISCALKTRCYQQACLPAAGTGQTSLPGCANFPGNANYNDSISSLAIDPLDHTHLIACAISGLYKSLDSGTTWTQMQGFTGLPANPACAAMSLHSASRTLFIALKTAPIQGPDSPTNWVGIDSWQGGVYKSTDFGSTWTNIDGDASDGLNVLPNPGFETNGDGGAHPAASWFSNADPAVSRDCTKDHSGSGCSIKIHAAAGPSTSGIHTDPPTPIEGGGLYRISMWVEVTNGKIVGDTAFPAGMEIFYFSDPQGNNPVYWPGDIPPYGNYKADVGGVVVGLNDMPANISPWRRFEAHIRPPDGAHYAWITFYALNGAGDTWIDDVSLRRVHSLPKLSGFATQPYFVSFSDVAVDPTDVNTIYVATGKSTALNEDRAADTEGLWKTSDGGSNWTLVTRASWHDNVQDGGASYPVCGDGVCGGRWETCSTCPADCTGTGLPASPACCGNGIQETGEDQNNCPVDVPFDPDPSPRPYYEVRYFDNPATGVRSYSGKWPFNITPWVIGMGSGAGGHQTIYINGDRLKSTDGGATWTEMSSTPYPGASDTLQARGDANDVYTYQVATDTRTDQVTGQAHDWVLYGDADNLLQVSYNGGKSFSFEGWEWSRFASPNTPVAGDSASSIVLDPNNHNRIYCGVNISEAAFQGINQNDPCCDGVVQGDYKPGTSPAVGHWDWTPIGNQGSLPPSEGGIDLLLAASGDFYASYFGKGLYKHVGGGTTGDWTCLGGVDPSCALPNGNWNPAPACGTDSPPMCWNLYRLKQEPSSQRMYVTAGDPVHFNNPVNAGETGIWESDTGASWCRISDPNDNQLNGMDKEPITEILLLGPNTMLASTWNSSGVWSTDPQGNYNGDGGIYRGSRIGATCPPGPSGNWTWTRVLAQPDVTGLAVSAADNSIVYAFVGQPHVFGPHPGQLAGIYKSLDGGITWSLLNDPLKSSGLMNLKYGQLYFHSTDPKKLYASTIGDGVFEGTVSCTDPVRDFECAARVNASAQVIPVIKGSIVSGSYTDTAAGSPDDVYEVLKESTSGKPQLTHVWTLSGALANVAYELRVEAYRSNASPDDSFNFSVATRASGNCMGSESYGSTLFTISNNSDTDTIQRASLPLTSNTVYCVKVTDSSSTDASADSLSVDRLYLLPLPNCPDLDGDGYTPTCNSTCYNAHCPAFDCNDSDAAINPGQTEGPPGNPTCTDTKDNDCDGLIDAADPGCASAPPDADADADTSIGPGNLVSGSYLDTRSSNDVYEVLQESVQQGHSRLVKVWRFDAVPSGSTHTLHVEGHRFTNDGDDFQFYYSTSASGPFTLITGAIINQTADPAGGIDSSTFGAGLSGTIYIQVKDTMPNNSTGLDQVYVDDLKIKTQP